MPFVSIDSLSIDSSAAGTGEEDTTGDGVMLGVAAALSEGDEEAEGVVDEEALGVTLGVVDVLGDGVIIGVVAGLDETGALDMLGVAAALSEGDEEAEGAVDAEALGITLGEEATTGDGVIIGVVAGFDETGALDLLGVAAALFEGDEEAEGVVDVEALGVTLGVGDVLGVVLGVIEGEGDR